MLKHAQHLHTMGRVRHYDIKERKKIFMVTWLIGRLNSEEGKVACIVSFKGVI